MPEYTQRLRIILSPSAQGDIRHMLIWSRERFGERAAVRHRDLLKQALRDVAANPERPGSKGRPELARGIRTYHLSFSRNRAQSVLGAVNLHRHLPEEHSDLPGLDER